MELDYGRWEFVYEDIKEVGAYLGLDIEEIYFSLYPHDIQLRASYKFPGPEAALLILYHYPNDREIQTIAGDLHDAQPKHTALSAKITPHHRHGSDYDIYPEDDDEEDYDEEGLEAALKRFSRWCLSQIDAEEEVYDNAA